MAAKTGQQKAEPARKARKLFGYARVSTTDQDLAVQRNALNLAGVGVIFEEKASGTKREGRTELQKVLSVLGEGDALVVTRLDRLGRSMRDLANIAHEIEQAGAYLKVIEQSVDTSTAAGRAFYGMLAVFAAFETDVAASASSRASRWPSARVSTRVARPALTASASRRFRIAVWGPRR